MKCPACGAAELIQDARDITYTYKGESTTIPAVKGGFCPVCDESVTAMAETDRVMREMQAFNGQVNAAIVDPVFIASVRKKLWDASRRADALQATPPLGPEASRALLKVVGPVSLTEKRRAELVALANEAQEAFKRPLPKNLSKP
jgi:putative zinc finger/helix-turn-helix YgiT family protein